MPRQRSSAAPLAAVYLLLVIYASLYPFEGWRWPPGLLPRAPTLLPWPRYHTGFDDWSNLLGYVPLGALLFAAVARSGGRTVAALVLGTLGPALLSLLLELAQNFVPGRVPSLRDWALNVGGALAGSLLALLAQRAGAFDRWQRVRERWFVPNSGGAIALLVLWPLALLFPPPVPLGLGQVFGELRSVLESAVEGTPWAAEPDEWFVRTDWPAPPLGPLRESLAIALGMLAPCLVAAVATQPGWRRAVMAVAGLVVAVVATTLSTALNFGPAHALAWMTPTTLPALGLVCLTALVAIVAEAPGDPYYAASLQGWEQGRFIRFHGIAQWLGWLWPYAAMGWLLARLTQRE
jgi:VanZ family protein